MQLTSFFGGRLRFRAPIVVMSVVVCAACTGSSDDRSLVTASALQPRINGTDSWELRSEAFFFCGDLNHPKPGDGDCAGRTVTQVYGQHFDFNLSQVLRLFDEAKYGALEKALQDDTEFNQSEYEMDWPVTLDVVEERGEGQQQVHRVYGTVPSYQVEYNWTSNFVYVPVANFAWPSVGPIWIDTMWITIFDPRPSKRSEKELCWAEFGGLGRQSGCEAAVR